MVVPRRASTRRLSVCLISAHPFVLDEWAALLGSAHIQARRLDARSISAPFAPSPRARVYVVDTALPAPQLHSLLAALRAAPSAHLIVVAQRFSRDDALSFLRLGVRGLLLYSQAREQLSHAVPAVSAGGFWVPREWLTQFIDSILPASAVRRNASAVAARASLSRREQQVLDALLENLSNKEIASRLGVSERTIKFHVSNVLAKFAVRRRADLILHFSQSAPSRSQASP